ncbi:MAG: dUTP diphosphatase [Gemmatimonadota bacterium]
MTDRGQLRLRRIGEHTLPLPVYASTGAAGLDLCAAQPHSLQPGERQLIGSGFAIALPEDSEGQIRPRSGLAARLGVTVLNAPGTIDADYRGEIKVLLINLGSEMVEIAVGDRIAQLIVAPVARWQPVEVPGLPETTRGAGGFGSTGR